MKYLFCIICCSFSISSFSQFFIGMDENYCRYSINQAEGRNVIVSKKEKDGGGFFLLWKTYITDSPNGKPIQSVVVFNNYGISYTFWEIFDDAATFNFFIKRFDNTFTKVADLEWNVYVKDKKFLVQGRYVEANGDYAIYYTDITQD